MSVKSAWTGARPHIDKSELLCKTGCGYYGNPAWNGHCSKCYKELLGKKQQRKTVFDPTQIKNKVSISVSDVSELQSKASSLMSRKFDRIDAKLDKSTKVVKSIFKKNQPSKAPDQGRSQHHFSEESQATKKELQQFIKSLNGDAQTYVMKHLRSFEERLQKVGLNHSVDDLSEQFQDFYYGLKDSGPNNPLIEGIGQDQSNKLCHLSESYITTRYYQTLLSIVNPFAEEKDLAIQNRIRSLMWVTCSHLECNIDESKEEIKSILDLIIAKLLEINSKQVPSDKLSLLVSASHQILNLLSKSSGGSPASADDFLPALIYCIIRANPPLLQSNICYITSFAQQSSLQSGEAGYFFTNLCCAVSFIEKLTAESLGLTNAEFDHYMSGDALSPNTFNGTYFCEGIRLMQQSLDSLEEYEKCLSKILSSYDDLTTELDECKNYVDDGLHFLMEKCPLTLKTKQANIDEPDPIQELLPPPLQPQSMHLEETLDPEVCKQNIFMADNSVDFMCMDTSIASSFSSQLEQDDACLNLSDNSAAWDPFSSIMASSTHKSPLSFHEDSSTSRKESSDDPLSFLGPCPEQSSTPQLLQPTYTGFTIQGGRIPSIPCDTGLTHSLYSPSNLLAPLEERTPTSLPPPLSPMIPESGHISQRSSEQK